MTCGHKEVVMVNKPGKRHEKGGNEIDFVIKCHDCDTELFRISEYGRTIVNLSSHLSEEERLGGYAGTVEALAEEIAFLSKRMHVLKNKMLAERPKD